MAYLDKIFLVLGNLNSREVDVYDDIIMYATDNNVGEIYLKLKHGNKYLGRNDIEDYEITVDLVKPSGATKSLTGMFDEEMELFKVEIDNTCRDEIGTYGCDIKVVHNNKTLTLDSFEYIVKGDIKTLRKKVQE